LFFHPFTRYFVFFWKDNFFFLATLHLSYPFQEKLAPATASVCGQGFASACFHISLVTLPIYLSSSRGPFFFAFPRFKKLNPLFFMGRLHIRRVKLICLSTSGALLPLCDGPFQFIVISFYQSFFTLFVPFLGTPP